MTAGSPGDTFVSQMKTATVRDLRNRFRHVSKWLEAGESVEILKHGKPFAALVPKSGQGPKVLLGCTAIDRLLPADVDEPVAADWDALR